MKMTGLSLWRSLVALFTILVIVIKQDAVYGIIDAAMGRKSQLHHYWHEITDNNRSTTSVIPCRAKCLIEIEISAHQNITELLIISDPISHVLIFCTSTIVSREVVLCYNGALRQVRPQPNRIRCQQTAKYISLLVNVSIPYLHIDEIKAFTRSNSTNFVLGEKAKTTTPPRLAPWSRPSSPRCETIHRREFIVQIDFGNNVTVNSIRVNATYPLINVNPIVDVWLVSTSFEFTLCGNLSLSSSVMTELTCRNAPVIASALGAHFRTRTSPINICAIQVIPRIDGGWSSWLTSVCSVTQGNGTREKRRACNSPTPQGNGNQCQGPAIITLPCSVQVDGSWGTWLAPSMCSVTCGYGTQSQERRCDNPTPSIGAMECAGDDARNFSCAKPPCPGQIDGDWGPWLSRSACSVTCGNGIQRQRRRCNQPAPLRGGRKCIGHKRRNILCWKPPCIDEMDYPPGILPTKSTESVKSVFTHTAVVTASVVGASLFVVALIVIVVIWKRKNRKADETWVSISALMEKSPISYDKPTLLTAPRRAHEPLVDKHRTPIASRMPQSVDKQKLPATLRKSPAPSIDKQKSPAALRKSPAPSIGKPESVKEDVISTLKTSDSSFLTDDKSDVVQ